MMDSWGHFLRGVSVQKVLTLFACTILFCVVIAIAWDVFRSYRARRKKKENGFSFSFPDPTLPQSSSHPSASSQTPEWLKPVLIWGVPVLLIFSFWVRWERHQLFNLEDKRGFWGVLSRSQKNPERIQNQAWMNSQSKILDSKIQKIIPSLYNHYPRFQSLRFLFVTHPLENIEIQELRLSGLSGNVKLRLPSQGELYRIEGGLKAAGFQNVKTPLYPTQGGEAILNFEFEIPPFNLSDLVTSEGKSFEPYLIATDSTDLFEKNYLQKKAQWDFIKSFSSSSHEGRPLELIESVAKELDLGRQMTSARGLPYEDFSDLGVTSISLNMEKMTLDQILQFIEALCGSNSLRFRLRQIVIFKNYHQPQLYNINIEVARLVHN